NARSFPQNPAITPPFRKPVSIAKLEKRDEIFSRESEQISKLGRYIGRAGDQRIPESGDHCVEHTPVVVAIRLHLNDSPLPFQKSEQTRNRATVAQHKLAHARRILFG